jgi:hypothetical protein
MGGSDVKRDCRFSLSMRTIGAWAQMASAASPPSPWSRPLAALRSCCCTSCCTEPTPNFKCQGDEPGGQGQQSGRLDNRDDIAELQAEPPVIPLFTKVNHITLAI